MKIVKILSGLFMFMLITANGAAANATEVLSGNPVDGWNRLEQIEQANDKLGNGGIRFNLEINAELPDMAAQIMADCDADSSNNLKAEWNVQLNQPGGKVKQILSLKMLQYLEVGSKNTAMLYTGSGTSWYKMMMPYSSAVRVPISERMQQYRQLLHSVSLVSENADEYVLEARVNGKAARNRIDEAMLAVGDNNQANAKPEKMSDNAGILAETMLEGSYRITVDKKTNLLKQLDFPLTEQARKAITIYIQQENMSKADRREWEAMAKAVKLDVKCIYKDYNNIEQITIPENIKKEAKPVEISKESLPSVKL